MEPTEFSVETTAFIDGPYHDLPTEFIFVRYLRGHYLCNGGVLFLGFSLHIETTLD